MSKKPKQKLKLLYLAHILDEQSDQEHPLTVAELIEALGKRGIDAERKSIYDDIASLELFGMDIVCEKGRQNSYYVGERRLQLPELKLLVDAVQSAKFITEKKSRELIQKICSLTSIHEARLMQRQVYVQGRAKTQNEKTYYNVDAIHTAIADNRQIEFRYYEWVADAATARGFTHRPRRSGQLYMLSPWTLLWNDEYYYLLAFDAESASIKNYRVDKMESIAKLDTAREGQTIFEKIDIAAYRNQMFGMFGGTETAVKIRFHNRLAGVVIDRFGSNIRLEADGDEFFTVLIKAVISPQFISWVLGFGTDAKVLSPAHFVEDLRTETKRLFEMYASLP